MSGALAHSPSEIVRRLLIDLGLGVVAAYTGTGMSKAYSGAPWPVFAGGEPDSPDSAITVYDTVGRLSGRTQPDDEMQEHNGIQVRVRAAAHGAGYAKSNEVAVALDQQVSRNVVTIGAAEYLVHAVTRTSDVMVLGTESPTSKRKLFTVNAVVSLEQTNL